MLLALFSAAVALFALVSATDVPYCLSVSQISTCVSSSDGRVKCFGLYALGQNTRETVGNSPNEMDNLIGNPRHKKKHTELSERLTARMKDTDDPLLNGPIPLPPDGTAVDPDGYWGGEVPGIR